jgi:hypothetical protein
MGGRELIRKWRRDGFKLEMYDDGINWQHHGRTRIAYRFWHNGTLIFEGTDFTCSPMHADDSNESVAALLSFLSLKPGDTDREYFEDYTPEQMEWCRQHGEDLSMIVIEMEERAERKRKKAGRA